MKEKKEVNWLKFRRKAVVVSGIVISPILLSQIGYYCQRFYEANNLTFDKTNYGSFFAMLGFTVIIVLMNLLNMIDNRKILKDVHNITQILLQVVLEDNDENKSKLNEILGIAKKYGGN